MCQRPLEVIIDAAWWNFPNFPICPHPPNLLHKVEIPYIEIEFPDIEIEFPVQHNCKVKIATKLIGCWLFFLGTSPK